MARGPCVLFVPELDRYVIACDVDAFDGRGDAVFGTLAAARVFADAGAALAYWKRQSTVRPLRPDGKPNRPLSAFTVEIQDAPFG